MSHLQRGFLDGTFAELERQSGVVPYTMSNEEFMFMYFLVDGIYPRYSRFVKAIRQPILLHYRKFTSFQESARKDIERAFGVFQCKWQASCRPIYLMDPILISEMITCCLILHNMCVSDRVMNRDVNALYVPTNNFNSPPETDVGVVANNNVDNNKDIPPIGIAKAPDTVRHVVSRHDRWLALQSLEEHVRLNNVLRNKFKE